MYQAPEVEHLQRAVDAVKRQILPRKKTEPDTQSEEDREANDIEERESEG